MIAIVGIACRYPDARSPSELWENVLAQRRAFRRMPAERLNLGDYFAPDPSTPDAIYATEAALIEGYEFDRVKFRVAGATYRSTDLTHWLALDVAEQALADAGLTEGEGLPRDSTGVLIGNTLTGEFSRAALMRLRWPYVRRVLDNRLAAEGWSPERRRGFLQEMEETYKAPFEPVGEETLAGGLSNTIAGRICNHFNLRGGGYTVDGACSSSLLAASQACLALQTGELDAALVGGVDLSLDPFELVGFSKTGALARDRMRVYDRDSGGFLPGEGCGIMVLMRHEDALARGLRCYALIRGWGISSDGGGGITRPEVEGQGLALERAYRRAAYGIDTVPLFEGHGTGTEVGDAVELQTLSGMLQGARTPAAIGSIKANIGHTKAAAGIAGLIKATLSLHTQILPPATGVDNPHPLLEKGPLRVLDEGECWPEDRPLRAGISSFGFGGINVHIALEGAASARRRRLTARDAQLLSSAQDVELFLFGSDDRAALMADLAHLGIRASGVSQADLADLAACLAQNQNLGAAKTRAAVVASTPSDLADRLTTLRQWLAAGETSRLDPKVGVFLGANEKRPRIALLFPGQASPVRLRGGAMARRFAEVRALYARANLSHAGDAVDTAVAQPAIVAAELAGLRLLNALGVEAEFAIGHSLGELTALHWAGAMDENDLLRIVQRRGQAMSEASKGEGAMASIAADPSAAMTLIGGEPQVVIAGLNSATQTVISGDVQALGRILARARTQGITVNLLPVSHAFHSPFMRPAAEQWAHDLRSERFDRLRRRVLSTVTGTVLEYDEDLHVLLERQLTEPVRYMQAWSEAALEIDFALEVGPGEVLSGLVRTGNGHGARVSPEYEGRARHDRFPHPNPLPEGEGEQGCRNFHVNERPMVLSLDCAGPSLRGLLQAIGAVYAAGQPINHRFLFADRFTRPFDLDRQPKFFGNPCESAPLREADSNPADSDGERTTRIDHSRPAAPIPIASKREAAPDALSVIRQLVAERAELPASSVKDHHHLLRDLHLNSISVGQLMAEAARQLGLTPPLAPTEFANATIAEAAKALETLREHGLSAGQEADAAPAGVDAWVHAFTVERIEVPLTPKRQRPAGNANWEVFAPVGHPLAQSLVNALEEWGGTGVLVCLLPDPDESQGALLLKAAHAALKQDGVSRYFVLVQHGGIAASFARTLHLEARNLTTCVVDVPFAATSCPWVLSEVQAAEDFYEAYYDDQGRRWEQSLRLLSIEADPPTLPLGTTDVLLVSGGGKGIAAECALSLARESGVRLALLGRARPEEDTELADNLARFSTAGVIFRYCIADVTDSDAVASAVAKTQAELGPITAILHGAGVNHPQSLRGLSKTALLETLGPKVQGLRNLLAAVEAKRLRVLVTFSSIIGRIGLRGEADYALANGWLSRMTEDFRTRHPACRCLALEWSIWSGVGMGERLGRVDALLREGITPIPLEKGIIWLRGLIATPTPAASTSIVVSGRLGSHPPLRLETAIQLPFLRFLEHPRVYYPGVELVADAELSSAFDPYLEDHVFQGERLLPAVLGLEAMAQAAKALVNAPGAPTFENIEFSHPIVVCTDKTVILRTAALLRKPGLVDVVLRSGQTAFQVDHFRATVTFGETHPMPDATPLGSAVGAVRTELGNRGMIRSSDSVGLDPEQDLYGTLLFHRGRFHRLRGYHELGAFHCRAEIATGESLLWFSRHLPQELLLGDPGSRDAAIHAIQACIPHATVLPIGLDRLLPGDLQTPGPWTVHARQRWQEDKIFCYDLEIHGADSTVRETWEGLRLRRVAEVSHIIWAPPLVAPYLERRLRELIPDVVVGIALERSEDGDRHDQSDRAMKKALREKSAIRRRPDGKPEAEGHKSVSAAHSGDLTLAVAGVGPVACDMEKLVEHQEQTWHDLLGAERYALAEQIAQATDESITAAATRVWTAAECLKKSGMPSNSPLMLLGAEEDGWILLSGGNNMIATCIVTLKHRQNPTVIAILAGSPKRRRNVEICAPTNTAIS